MKSSTFRTQNAERGTQTSAPSAHKVAEEFASLLLLEMLKSMRATLSSEGLDGALSASPFPLLSSLHNHQFRLQGFSLL